MMESNSIKRNDVIGLCVKRVLQTPWKVELNDSKEPRYCCFYLLLETGLVVQIFEEWLTNAHLELSGLIDTDELDPAQRAHFIERRITAVGIDHETSDLVVIFDSGYWLTPKISHMGYGNYLLAGRVSDLYSPDREEPIVDYFDGTEMHPWVILDK